MITAILIGPLAQHREILRILLIFGVLGGIAIFSSFAIDTLELVDNGKTGQAAVYILISNLFGLFAAWGCYRGGSMLFNTTPV